jgi:hypothetical protein
MRDRRSGAEGFPVMSCSAGVRSGWPSIYERVLRGRGSGTSISHCGGILDSCDTLFWEARDFQLDSGGLRYDRSLWLDTSSPAVRTGNLLIELILGTDRLRITAFWTSLGASSKQKQDREDEELAGELE